MKRQDIKAILPDIEDDDLKKLLNLFHTEMDTIRDEKDDIQAKLDKAEADLKTANAGKEKAEKDLTDFKNQQSANETKAAKEKAFRDLLTDAGIGEKHQKLIVKATDFSSIELDDKGGIKDADKLSASVKTDYADYITSTSKKGADVPNPPSGGGNTGKYKDKNEIMAIKDAAERQAAIAENHEWFGF